MNRPRRANHSRAKGEPDRLMPEADAKNRDASAELANCIQRDAGLLRAARSR